MLEEQGIATVTLGITRQQLVSTAPPRGLYVDFPLGRPLGRPQDPEFQHRVLRKALDLVETATEPIFAEFDEAIREEGEILACTIPPTDDADAHPAVAEARGLRAAYNRTIATHGERMGAFRILTPDTVPDALQIFADIAGGADWKEAGIPGIPARVSQDIRGYYEAVAVSLADHTPGAFEATRWFLHHTEAGATLLAARKEMERQGAKQPLWYYLVPEHVGLPD